MKSIQSRLIAVAVAAACALPASQALAAPVHITFDANDPIGGLAVGAVLGNQYADYGIVFTPNAYNGGGGPNGPWAGNTDMSIVNVGGDTGNLGGPSLVSGHLLRAFNDGWFNENGDASFAASFTHGVTSFSADFAGVDEPHNTRLFAYSGNTLLGSVAGAAGAAGAAAGANQFTLSFSSLAPITRIVVTPGSYSDWVGVDNISYEVAAVPEPSTYAMLGLGLCLLGLRKRKSRV